LGLILWDWYRALGTTKTFDINGPITSVLLVLAVMLVVEAFAVMYRTLRARAVVGAA
jgi:hypothetical protein